MPSINLRRVLSREALIVLGFSGFQLALGLVGTRLLTQAASPTALGEYYLYMNLALWLTLPTSSSYLYVWKRWTIARASGRERRFSRSIVRGLLWQGLICLAGCIVMAAAGLLRWSWLILWALCATSIGQAVNQALDQVQTLERRRVLAGVLGLLATPIRQLALAAGIALMVRQSGETLLATQGAYGMATAALTAWLFLRTVHTPYGGERARDEIGPGDFGTRRFLQFSVPFLVTGIATQGAASAERWGLALRATPEATALFVQASAVALAAVTAATLPVTTYFTPIISQAAAQSTGDPLGAAARPLRLFILTSLVSAGLACAAVSIFALPITSVLFAPSYRHIGVLLPWAMVGCALFAVSQAVALIPISADATVGVSVAIVASKLVYLALLVLMPRSPDPALLFTKCFAFGNLLHLVAMSLIAARAKKARALRLASSLERAADRPLIAS